MVERVLHAASGRPGGGGMCKLICCQGGRWQNLEVGPSLPRGRPIPDDLVAPEPRDKQPALKALHSHGRGRLAKALFMRVLYNIDLCYAQELPLVVGGGGRHPQPMP